MTDNNSPTNPSSKEAGPPDRIWVHPWPEALLYLLKPEQGYIEYTRVSADSAGAMVDAVKVAERIVIYLAGKYIDPSAGSMEVQPIANIIAAAVPRDEAAPCSEHKIGIYYDTDGYTNQITKRGAEGLDLSERYFTAYKFCPDCGSALNIVIVL